MKWTDEELMAYADGELIGERRDAFDQAMKHDAHLRERVSALGAQRQRFLAAFAGVLDEPIPQRLTALFSSPAIEATAPQVVELASLRESRNARRVAASWVQWGGMAASVVLGVVLGMQLNLHGALRSNDALVSEVNGRIVATGRLAQALSSQLAADTAKERADTVAVQLSFVDKGGQYCRTFNTDRMAGLACRGAADWTIQTATAIERLPSNEMRQAASALPRAVLEAVDERIAGTALTAEQEQRARALGWGR